MMEKPNTQLVDSKTGRLRNIKRQLVIMSRSVTSKKVDDWETRMVFDGNETAARQELRWLRTHSYLNEYKLVAKITKSRSLADILDDDISHLY